MSLKISVYVPCYNAERTIGACIASLIAQRRKPDEILIVDDGSTDRTVEIAKRYPGVKIIQHAVNKGLGTARNSGIRFSKGDVIASIDSDCAADPHWLRILAAELEKNPDLHGVAGAVNETERGTAPDRWRTFHMPQHYGRRVIDNPRFLFGANTLYRREVFDAVGTYLTSMRTNGEDFDICKRIYDRIPDAKLRYLPSAVVNHLRRDSYKSIAHAYWRYQTYVSWARPHPRGFGRTVRQTINSLKPIWKRHLPWDFKHKRWESLLVAVYITVMLPRLQIRQHFANKATFEKWSAERKLAESGKEDRGN